MNDEVPIGYAYCFGCGMSKPIVSGYVWKEWPRCCGWMPVVVNPQEMQFIRKAIEEEKAAKR